jgi:hypothetical protein
MGVFIVASVGSFNDWQKEKQFLRLQAESDKDNTVSSFTSLWKEFDIHNFVYEIESGL